MESRDRKELVSSSAVSNPDREILGFETAVT